VTRRGGREDFIEEALDILNAEDESDSDADESRMILNSS